MAVYQDRAKERIRKQLSKQDKRIKTAIDNKIGESDTRRLVEDVLVDMLGWDKYDNITGESPIAGGYADFILRKGGRELAVIEIKKVSVKLNDSHFRQARDYAANQGIPWVILTNGDTWTVYNLSASKQGVEVQDVFTVRITDQEMKPADKADLLYLLSEEAWRKDELAAHLERNCAMAGEQMISRLLTPEIMSKLRLEIKRTSGHRVTNREVADALVGSAFRTEALPKNVDTLLKRISTSDKK